MSQTRHCDVCKKKIGFDDAYWMMYLEPDETDSGRKPIERDLCIPCKERLDTCIEGLTK
jgi:hypothetical protein